MTEIIVIRGDGDRPGDDIIDPLMSTVAVAIQRGRNEIDTAALADGEALITTFLPEAALGHLIEVLDPAQGGAWRGKVTGLVHQVTLDESGNMAIESRLDVRKPR